MNVFLSRLLFCLFAEDTGIFPENSVCNAIASHNLNPQKLELLLHRFFGKVCLDVDVFDRDGKRYTPREWFMAPLPVIEEVIELIISGKIIDYVYDDELKLVSRK
jgi:hypothetical protein